ncbi:hypothetical protein OSB04_006409 [Centaurea solstitialis]|uniref:40S ribosomal protein S8 n=1 Tax=Centaurea solstitialis TaxID=347529 RepID=A0AA38TJM2_9ASTR|nr:hypothetical protein OSB04_006409 [Centaurea solstitialis]
MLMAIFGLLQVSLVIRCTRDVPLEERRRPGGRSESKKTYLMHFLDDFQSYLDPLAIFVLRMNLVKNWEAVSMLFYPEIFSHLKDFCLSALLAPNLYELGRQPANTKISSNKTVRRVRVRGGNVKWRALRLDTGNFSWGSEAVTRKTRILDVVYNASNNELVRTQTLVKSAIVQVDAAPFKQWYLQHYGVDIGRKKKPSATATKKEGEEAEAATEEAKKSNHVVRKLEKRQEERKLDGHVEEQFSGGRLYAAISSRPGQCGRADGYILEGKELEFYMKKLQKKKGKGAA